MSKISFSADIGFFKASNANYYLHCHNAYEIYMFIEGDSKYIVEGKQYSLEPYDIIIIRKHEMHRVFHNSDKPYRRLSLMVSPDFFTANNCSDYEAVFCDGYLDKGNKIPSDVVRSSGLYDAFMRFTKYTQKCSHLDSLIARISLMEILHLINTISDFQNPDIDDGLVKNIINYINNHLTDSLTLDLLCETFFISKYHLCRIFKKRTGLTIHTYIKQKRLNMVDELRKQGENLTEAATRAGFHDYTSFYRTYIQTNGYPPSKKINTEYE